jgi:hypothetical protein
MPGTNSLAYFCRSINGKEKSFITLTPGVSVIKLFPSSLTMRPNKLECLSLETLSSQVLEFKSKSRANPIGAPFRYFFLGEALGATSKCLTRLESDRQVQTL